MNQPAHIEAYWQAFLQQHPEAVLYETFQFAGGGTIGDTLGALVVAGTKTATCSAYDLYEKEGDALPEVGHYSIVLNSREEVLALIQTTHVEIVPFNEVSEEFALAEGEGDYEDWWEGHVRFFSQLLPQYDVPYREDMLVVCERFRVVQ